MTQQSHGWNRFPAEIRKVEVDGQVLRAGIWKGNAGGLPLLVFNGIGANLELVEPLVAVLEGIEVIIFDVPGVGGSPAPPMPYRLSKIAGLSDRLLHILGYCGAIDVLGISWGGALAQQFAHAFPERCRRLVLASTSPGSIMVPGKLSALSNMLNPRRYTDPNFLHKVGGKLYGGDYRRNPALLHDLSRHIRPSHGRGYFFQLLSAWGWTSLPWLGSLRQPTLVMHGTDDPIVPLVNAKILAALIPQATLHLIDDGHLFMVSRATEVGPVIRHFLFAEEA